jgi:N-acetylmuramoyl-L-alanine amidase
MKTRNIIAFALCNLLLASCNVGQVVKAGELLAIDVGHSKKHPGSTSATGIPEFEFNAVLANAVSDFLSAHGQQVLQIGADGGMDNLKKRTLTANQAQAKFFLSIHHDSVQPRYLKTWEWQGIARQYSDYAAGFSLFVSRKNSDLATSLKCASAIGAALKSKGFQISEHHAETISGENRAWADKENGVYFYDDLVVLKTAEMPAVLLEAGVIVNRGEEQNLQKAQTHTNIASAIETGLRSCGAIS